MRCFPTIADLIEYLFHIHIAFPVQTFGFFVALAFIAAYRAFTIEFKRKERQGLVHAFKRKLVADRSSPIIEYVLNGLLGFLLGFKILGVLLNYEAFKSNPSKYIFSTQGSLVAGLLCAIAYIFWIYTDRKKLTAGDNTVTEETVHPYQLMSKIVFYAGIWGLIGAKLFDIVDYLHKYGFTTFHDVIFLSGVTYYGGFLFGMLAYFYVGMRNGVKLPHLADIGAPGIMLAYAVGRIGCQLSGDGDWGIVNTHIKPGWLNWLPDWMWAFNFPHNILNQDTRIPDCYGNYCYQLSHAVYPTSFYETVLCLLIFAFLWYIRKYLKKPGLMSYTYLVLSSAERYFIENIRINTRYDVLGAYLSQAQILSIGMCLVGVCGVIYLCFIKKR
jgi:phosphatidylglycerol---prolipoprotein diacylglyceryl transferase